MPGGIRYNPGDLPDVLHGVFEEHQVHRGIVLIIVPRGSSEEVCEPVETADLVIHATSLHEFHSLGEGCVHEGFRLLLLEVFREIELPEHLLR